MKERKNKPKESLEQQQEQMPRKKYVVVFYSESQTRNDFVFPVSALLNF